MDLSAEAEAFGCTLHLSETEIPSVTGNLVTTIEQARKLPVPQPGDRRTTVHLETVRRLRTLPAKPLVLGGCIGPFSLAARLVGVSEAMEMTVTEPDLMHCLVEKSSEFLIAYLDAFYSAGADGVIMAEPAAGLLSPRGLATYSSAYVKLIHASRPETHFALILHNCAAKALHLPAILESGVQSLHFGAPMDLSVALAKVPANVVVCGNLDPSAVFCQSSPAETVARAAALLAATRNHENFVLSSGCDVPPNAPLANLDAFYAVVETVRNIQPTPLVQNHLPK
jgi:uroporphyrinogen decarboxylase